MFLYEVNVERLPVVERIWQLQLLPTALWLPHRNIVVVIRSCSEDVLSILSRFDPKS
ncbi:hypothetical protein [Shewanella canadensis]|uniref:hypothetical protein n=1 Tax=Shewanella canadensis TaxID=271096 RepID=UPI00163B1D04|nr:hypothetical protein [Shewanella canadensis]